MSTSGFGLLHAQVFFRAEGGEAAAVNGISGTHMLLWLPHFHDFCLTVSLHPCIPSRRFPATWQQLVFQAALPRTNARCGAHCKFRSITSVWVAASQQCTPRKFLEASTDALYCAAWCRWASWGAA